MRHSRLMTLPALLSILVLVLAACGSTAESTPAGDGDGGDGGTGGTETVSMANTEFTPSNLEIAPGTTVTWTDTAGHTVTEGQDGTAVEDPIIDEQGGSDISFTFDEPGTYNITCTIHPSMNMTIIVTD